MIQRPSAVGFFLLLFVAGMASWASPLQAQAISSECVVVSFRVWDSESFGPGQRISWLGRPVLDCPDGTRIQADSAVIYEADGRSELIGQVFIRDPERELRSESADYYEADGRLLARGNVHYRDLVSGTEFEGQDLVYLEADAFRPQPQLTVTGLPARATLPPGDGPASPDAEPYRVSGNQLRVEDGSSFWADGNVEVERDSLRARSDALFFDRSLGSLVLTGAARLELEGTELDGGRIQLSLPGDELREIHAFQGATLVTDGQELRAGEIRIDLEEGEVSHLVAVHREGPGGGGGPVRPHAVTSGYLLVADSIELLTEDGEERWVEAHGRAWAESHEEGTSLPDLSQLPRERDFGSLPSIEQDWIQGDLIVAMFARVPGEAPSQPEAPAAGGAFRPGYLQATGSAASFYRSPPQDRADVPDGAAPGDRSRWGISYLLADEIVLHFLDDGEVDRVDARGNVSGVQLEPVAGAGGTAGQEDRE